MRFLFLFISLLSLSASAQPVLKAELSRNLTGDTYYTIQYTIEGADKVTSFTPPSFRDLELLKGPEQTHGFSLKNGELQPYVNFIYVVRPARTGRIQLNDAVAVADGQTLHSGPVEIFAPGVPLRAATQTTPGDLDGFLLRKGEKVEDKLRGNLFVRLTISRAKCYVGEPVVAEYKLYTRLNSESRVVKRPSFNGFSVYDMAPQESGAVLRETYHGKLYDVYPLRKVMMYPLQAGALELDPLEVENQVSFVNAESLGGGSLSDALRAYGEGHAPAGSVVKEKVTVANAPQTLQVMALPDTGKPNGFNGAVGRFTITARINPSKVEQGVVAYLDVTLSGQGNLPVVSKPNISWPAGAETFEDSIREDYNHFKSPERWSKTFTIPFTMSKSGQQVIPAIRLLYFDPDSGHYRSTTTEPVRFNVVAPGTKVQLETGKTGFWGGQTDRIWLLLPVLLVLGMVVLFILQRMRERKRREAEQEALRMEEWAREKESKNRVVKTPLEIAIAESALSAGEPMAFYRAVEQSIRKWLQDNGSVSGTMRQQAMSILRDAESKRFDPLLDAQSMQADMVRLSNLAHQWNGSADQSVNL